MAITKSIGYDGTIGEGEHARLMAEVGTHYYSVVGPDDFKVAPDSSVDRGIRILPGVAYGFGIMDYNNAAIVKGLDPITTGTQRYDLIVVRRNFTTNTTTIEVLKGNPTSLPAYNADSAAGVSSLNPYSYLDQPIAWVIVRANQTAVGQIQDMRLQIHKVISAPTFASLPFTRRPGAVARVTDTRKEYSATLQPDGTVQWVDTSVAQNFRRYLVRGQPTLTNNGQGGGGSPQNIALDSTLENGSDTTDIATSGEGGRVHTILTDGVYCVLFDAYSDATSAGHSFIYLSGAGNLNLASRAFRGTGFPVSGTLEQEATRTLFLVAGSQLRLWGYSYTQTGVNVPYTCMLSIERVG